MKFQFEIYFKTFLLLALVVLSACNSKNSPSDNFKENRINEVNKSVFCLSVVIPNAKPRPKRAIGTGFLVSENLLATAFHVKEDLDKTAGNYLIPDTKIIAWKKFDNGDYIEIPLKPAAVDQDSDMALYSFDADTLKQQAKARDIKPLPLTDRLPNPGEDILSTGYYGTMEFPFNSLGNVSTIDNGEDIYADMTLLPGNSGSPLISMKTGEVLGLNIKVMTMGDGTIRLGIAKKSAKLKLLIEKNISK